MVPASNGRNWFRLKGTTQLRTLCDRAIRTPHRWFHIWRIRCALFFLQCKEEFILYTDWNSWAELSSLPWAEILKAGSKPMNTAEDNFPPWPPQPGIRRAEPPASVEVLTVKNWPMSTAVMQRISSNVVSQDTDPTTKIPSISVADSKLQGAKPNPNVKCGHGETKTSIAAVSSMKPRIREDSPGVPKMMSGNVAHGALETRMKNFQKAARGHDQNDSSLTMDPLHDYTPFCAMLLGSSLFLLPLPAIVAYWLQLRTSCLFAILVCVTSINHWRLPKLSWRRTIDIVAVRTNILYHLYQALQRDVIWPFGLIWLLHAAVAFFLYLASRGLGKRGKFTEASMLHLGLHFTAATGNTWICFGIARAAVAGGA